MQRSDFIKKQFTEKILEMLPKQGRRNSDAKQRKFLIQCIDDLGYIKKRPVQTRSRSYTSDSDTSDSDTSGTSGSDVEPDYHELQPGYTESSSSSNPYGFERTFIQDPTDKFKNLLELQKRGISTEESEFTKVSEIIDQVLNKIQRTKMDIDTVKIKEFALKMYQEILNYYKTNEYNFKSNSQSIKRGYIALVVWYSLINSQINISRENLVSYFNKTIVADLFESDKYLKRIISKLPTLRNNLCGMEQSLKDKIGTDLLDKIFKVIENFDSSPKYTAAAVYYICSVPIYKGGVLPSKIKGITLEYLENNCKITQSTISKGVKDIIAFYSLHQDLKSILLTG